MYLHTHSQIIFIARILGAEVDTLVERIHQAHGIELGLNALERGSEKRGRLERKLHHESDGDASSQLRTCSGY